MNYRGIDQHKQCLHLTLMDEESKILKARAGELPPHGSHRKSPFYDDAMQALF